ncbi:MAG: NUDIX domain-containing protein [Actinobacteria bacterium]|nr:NUDIX domain-containing protein [Actinomycetota bacterium]
MHYPQLKVGVGAIIERGESILLLRRTTAPFQAMWNLPAGYVEEDESPERALIREVLEETGIEVQVKSIAGAHYFDDDPRGNGVLLTFLCSSNGTDPQPSAEATEPTFFTRETIPLELAGGGHDQAIRAWQGGESPHNRAVQRTAFGGG